MIEGGTIRRRWICALFAAALVPAARPQAVPVTVDPVRTERLGSTARVTGSLRSVSRAGVATQEPGLVTEVLVDVGSVVRAGDVLARLDARRLRAELAALAAEREVAQAQERAAQSDAEYATTDFERVKRLRESGTAASIEFVRVKTNRDAAQARITAAQRTIERIKAREDLLQIRLGDMELRAPFDGAITDRAVDPGEWLSAGDPIVTMVSTGIHEAWLEIPERYLGDVEALGSSLRVQAANTQEALRTERVRLSPEVEPRVRTFMAIVDVSSSRNDLVPGMSVTAWVPTSAVEERLTVHKDALIRDPGGFLVFVARAQGEGHVATPVPVKVAFETDARVAVFPGAVRPGDLVIVEGNERLYAGAMIAPESATPQ